MTRQRIDLPYSSYTAEPTLEAYSPLDIVDRDLIDGAEEAYLTRIGILPLGGGIVIDLGRTPVIDTIAGPMFKVAMERSDFFATLVNVRSGEFVVMKGPDNPDNSFRDTTEPYLWTTDNFSDVSDFFTGIMQDDEAFVVFSDEDEDIPGKPPPPTFSDIQNTSVTVSFGPANAGGYVLLYTLRHRESPSGAWTEVENLQPDYEITGLTEGETYDIQVNAKNGAGTSAWSDTQQVRLGPPAKQDKPLFAAVTDHNLRVLWRPDVGATAYDLQWRIFPGSWNLIEDLVISPYVTDILEAGEEYEWRLRGMNATGEGAWSDWASVRLLETRMAPAIQERSDLIIGQYAAATRLHGLADGLLSLQNAQLMEPLFSLDDLGHLERAYGVWLDFIGDRLGLLRPHVPGADIRYFGFDEGSDRGTWDEVPFFDRVQALENLEPLDDDRYRSLLRGRGLSLRLGTSVPDIETVAAAVFTFGGYVTENSDGTLTLYAEDDRVGMADLVADTNVIPRPAGISLTIEDL